MFGRDWSVFVFRGVPINCLYVSLTVWPHLLQMLECMESCLHSPICHSNVAAPVNFRCNLLNPQSLPFDKLTPVVTPNNCCIYNGAPLIESNTHPAFLNMHTLVIFWVASYKYSLFKLRGTYFCNEWCSNSCCVYVSEVNVRHCPVGVAPASLPAGRGFKFERGDLLVL
jgi:hypothetical protein